VDRGASGSQQGLKGCDIVQRLCLVCATEHNAKKLTCRKPGCKGSRPQAGRGALGPAPAAPVATPGPMFCWGGGADNHRTAACQVVRVRIAEPPLPGSTVPGPVSLLATGTALAALVQPHAAPSGIEPTTAQGADTPAAVSVASLQALRETLVAAALDTEAIDLRIAALLPPPAPKPLHARLRELQRHKAKRERELAVASESIRVLEDAKADIVRQISKVTEDHVKAQEAYDVAVRDPCAVATEISEAMKVEAGGSPAREDDESDLVRTLRGPVARTISVPADEHALYAKFMAERGETEDLDDPMLVDRCRYLKLVTELRAAPALLPPGTSTSEMDEDDHACCFVEFKRQRVLGADARVDGDGGAAQSNEPGATMSDDAMRHPVWVRVPSRASRNSVRLHQYVRPY